MTAYYNEIDPFAAQWLRTLITQGHLPRGDVDERSIEDVKPDDLRTYTQCHFFAGIGVWAYALRLAGWDDDRPVWTGSCPCQPFSAVGKAIGFDDQRHLWPAWFHLIQHAKPRSVPVFGEQVASKDGLAWLDLVHADLEGAGHTVRAIDLCAAGVGAPHIRQRLWFVANSDNPKRRPDDTGWHDGDRKTTERQQSKRHSSERIVASGLAHPDGGNSGTTGIQRGREYGQRPEDGGAVRSRNCGIGHNSDTGMDGTGPTNGHWRDTDWLYCRDGKWRPVEPGTFPLVNGAPARMGRLRGYGNAINAEAAKAFIEAYDGVVS